MKRIIISMLLLALLCSTILWGCTEDKEVATKDEVAVTTTATSTANETTTSEVITSTSATETTVSTTVATTVVPVATETTGNEQEEVDDDYVNESNNSGSENQNNDLTENISNNTDKSTTNSNNGKVTKIVFDNDYITMDVGDVVNVGFTMDGIPTELHCNLGQPNQIKTKVLFTDRAVQVTACRAGEATFTLSTENGVETTCTVYVNYPSVENITYDEILTFDQMNTEKVSQIICEECNKYFPTLGMTYDSSLNEDNSGWFIGYHWSAYGSKDNSINDMVDIITDGIMQSVDSVCVNMYGATYDKMKFNTTYFIDGESYVIVFCYK
ncbi:MAG: hypothetical protein IJ341_01815 [Bacteroidales bacterium]|nr:hypothetical protein [Bacteroidales bacterium]